MHFCEIFRHENFNLNIMTAYFSCRHNAHESSYTQEKEPRVTSLRTCRQIYHEARNVLFSATHFAFDDPRSAHLYLRRLSHTSLRVQRVDLKATIWNRKEEREWNKTFYALAEQLKDLRYLSIKVDEYLWNYWYDDGGRPSPALGKIPFLAGLLKLKKVPLKRFELIVSHDESRDIGVSELSDDGIWTADQKRQWAQSIKNAIMGKD